VIYVKVTERIGACRALAREKEDSGWYEYDPWPANRPWHG
jgi:hypothetical protein